MSVPSAGRELNQYLQSLLPGAYIAPLKLQQCPEIRLNLLNENFPRHDLGSEVTSRLMDEPPYWAFCWASGQVLARFILDRPDWVSGKHVVDFGAGSGVVGIAAALAGAAKVSCCDIDPLARLAMEANAALNGVELLIADSLPTTKADLLTLADVLYDRENLPLLDQLADCAERQLLADSRIRDLRHPRFELLGQYQSCTWPDLDESAEFNTVRLYVANAERPSVSHD